MHACDAITPFSSICSMVRQRLPTVQLEPFPSARMSGLTKGSRRPICGAASETTALVATGCAAPSAAVGVLALWPMAGALIIAIASIEMALMVVALPLLLLLRRRRRRHRSLQIVAEECRCHECGYHAFARGIVILVLGSRIAGPL